MEVLIIILPFIMSIYCSLLVAAYMNFYSLRQSAALSIARISGFGTIKTKIQILNNKPIPPVIETPEEWTFSRGFYGELISLANILDRSKHEEAATSLFDLADAILKRLEESIVESFKSVDFLKQIKEKYGDIEIYPNELPIEIKVDFADKEIIGKWFQKCYELRPTVKSIFSLKSIL